MLSWIIHALRKFVKRSEPTLSEAVKWGNGCWINDNGPVAYVYSDTAYVQFGFFRGSSLRDPKGLLEGKGQYVRHIKVRHRSAIDERAFRHCSGKRRDHAKNVTRRHLTSGRSGRPTTSRAWLEVLRKRTLERSR